MTQELPETPITREEMYLAAVAGQDVDLPEKPITRREMYLAKIAEDGGTGVTSGYYYNGAFYKDSAHTTVITPKAGQLYYDISGLTLYLYNGTSYISIGLNTVGHFLSAWNCATGLPTTDPTTIPYAYTTGDYYIVGNVGTGTNYRPNGSSYTRTASTTVETGNVQENDFYFYDGTSWLLLKNNTPTIATESWTFTTSTGTTVTKTVAAW